MLSCISLRKDGPGPEERAGLKDCAGDVAEATVPPAFLFGPVATSFLMPGRWIISFGINLGGGAIFPHKSC